MPSVRVGAAVRLSVPPLTWTPGTDPAVLPWRVTSPTLTTPELPLMNMVPVAEAFQVMEPPFRLALPLESQTTPPLPPAPLPVNWPRMLSATPSPYR